MFTSQPQAIEVYQAGTWWAGELLGWRHDADGSCQVWVRVVLGGVEETAWTDLTTLRLPERHLSMAQPAASPRGPATQEMSVARHPSGRRPRSADADAQATGTLPMGRDLSVVPDLPSGGGRRTSDETARFASVGRRRAPETGASPSVGRRRAPESAMAAAPAPAPSPGRHRASAPPALPAAPDTPAPPAAPADPGRHRTADTGLFPAMSRPPRPAQPEKSPSRDAWTAPEGMEAELLTRPMRMSDHVPHSRRPRLGGPLSV